MIEGLRHYFIVTAAYWTFTITDGAIRMLVVLYFHTLGYSPFEVAMLFLLYEFFGIITNLVGGWLGARIGLNLTMHIGMAMQIAALLALTVPESWLSVPYVMMAQALSGIAKDLNKMSAKASVKTMLRDSHGNNDESSLFKWVAILTGSKNALKGIGFFVGAILLEIVGFRMALVVLAGLLFMVFIITFLLLPSGIGKMKTKPKFSQVFSHISAINWLSASRFFLFASRDVWFVVGLPVFLFDILHWSLTQIGSFMALWVIAYGLVQAFTPKLIKGKNLGGRSACLWAFILALFPALIVLGLNDGAKYGLDAERVLVTGLILFGIVFAINSAIHSYLILAYSDHDKVAMSVGFYYMANAGGRLTGTIISGLSYQMYGLQGCLLWSTAFVLIAALLSFALPEIQTEKV